MQFYKIIQFFFIMSTAWSCSRPSENQDNFSMEEISAQNAPRLEWRCQSRFGLFIHCQYRRDQE